MSIPANRRNITAEELLQHPEWGPCELVEGEVVPVSPTKRRHWRIAGRVAKWLALYEDKLGRGRLGVAEPGLFVERRPDSVRVPDVLFTFSEDEGEGFEDSPPALCVEVMSDSNTWAEMAKKTRQYLGFGVGLVWIIDPETRTVYVYRQDGSTAICRETDTLTGGDALPDLEVPVADLFN